MKTTSLLASICAGIIALPAAAIAQDITPPALVKSADAIAKARADSSRYPYTTADIDFMRGMIHHHSQAIVMSRWAPTHGASPQVVTLCARIINAQNDEIRLMSQWLMDRNQEVPAPTAGPMKMKMNGMEMDMLMPGMLTEAEMKELDQSREKDFDVKFLRGMLKHHAGATGMVKDLLGTYGAAQDEMAAKLAQDINIDQLTEIARMEKMLAIRLGIIDPS